MIAILKRFFIKDADTSSAYVRKSYAMLCSIVGIILNLLMFIGKSVAGSISGSVAITADGYNNLGDAVTNIENFFGAWVAGLGAGKNHPGGHGRADWMVALLAGYAVLTMGIHQLANSIREIRNPSKGQFDIIIVMVLLISILIKVYMWFYNKQVGKEIESLSMKAVSTDCLTDVVSTSVVLLSLIVEHYTSWHLDGWCGALVALFIIYAGFDVLSSAIVTILGRGADAEVTSKIEELVKKSPYIKGMHSLMLHDYGAGRRFVSFYIEGDEKSDIIKLYNEGDKLSYEISKELGCETIVAVDIVIRDKEVVEEVKQKVQNEVSKMSPSATIDEFKMIRYLDHIDVFVIIGITMNENSKSEKYCEKISKFINELNEEYVPIVKTLLRESENQKGRRHKRRYDKSK